MAFDILSFAIGKAAGGGAEEVETSVALDFSGGDMEVTPNEGEAFSKVTIPQPETLVAENIAEGVTVAGIEGTHSGGGGSVEGVHFVTFMSEDGSTELYKRPVADGDDCADPVDRGLISEPTKESTAQYSYTFMGWATEPNGGVNNSALSAVTADKTVYANFAAVLRYYTVTYYDSDGTTVLKTESLAYGATPSYVPKKDDYNFVAWVPNATVTGDMSYTATWELKPAFGLMTWAEISAITTAGTSANYFTTGDTKSEILTYSDGTTEEIEFVIVHIRENGTMVLALNHALETKKPIHSDSDYDTVYLNNDIGQYLVNTVLTAFPSDLSAILRTFSIGMTSGQKIRLLTSSNLWKADTRDYSAVETESYPYFGTQENRRRKINGTYTDYWIGTLAKASTAYYYGHVDIYGVVQSSKYQGIATGVTNPRGVVFAIDV